VGNFVFDNGAVATVEVTWSVEQAGFAASFHLVGTKGQLLSDMAGGTHTIRRIQFGGDGAGWQDVEAQPERGDMTTHMLQVLRGEAEPVANEDDSRATLAACLAFYEAARDHTVVTI
jgi:predicted dehydrogenase